MKVVRVTWEPDDARFVAEGTHADRRIVINAPNHDPPATGFSASELLLAGVGACSAWDVVDMLRKQRQDVTGVDVTVTGEQEAEPPWPYRRVEVEYEVRGTGLSKRAVDRAVRLSVTKYCSVMATIRPTAAISTSVRVVDEATANGGQVDGEG